MNAITFANPWLLVLLWLVPLAAFALYWLRERRQRQVRAWVSPAMQARQLPAHNGWRFALQLTLISLGFALALIALARPRFGEIQDKVTRRGRDLMLVLDVSRSMLAADAAPNRLERAKADLIDLINSLDGDRAGLILFRHKAAPVCPLTTDYAFLLQMLDAASPDSAPPGETDIGDAIRKAMDALDLQQSGHQAIVLVSDGEDLAGSLDEAVAKAKERGITLFTVGFGSLSGTSVPDPEGGRMTYHGSEVTSKLNPVTLRSMAARTGGVYVPVGTARVNLGDLYRDHLRKLNARELDETVTRRRIERFTWFLLPALLLWLAAAAFSAGRPLLRSAKTAAALFVALCLWPGTGRASDSAAPGDPVRLARQAQSQYRAGRYTEAADLYRKAAGQSRDAHPARDYFNAGCALFHAGKYQEAADLFRLAGSSKPDPSIPSAYNLGCSLLQDAQATAATNAASAEAKAARIVESAQAFQESVRSAPATRQAQALNNLSLAGAKAGEARAQAKELRLQEQYGSVDAPQLAQQLLDRQRRLGPAVAAALSNNTPAQITQFEAAGAEARELAEMIGPLGGKLEQAISQSGGTNAAAQVAGLRQYAAGLNDLISRTADRLRDADPSVQDMIPAGERAAYTLWKGVAPFDLVLREDIRVQSNAIPLTAKAALPRQAEAGDLTRLFAQRFAQTVPEGGQPSQDTNNPGITAETRAKILKLASEAAGLQDQTVKEGTEAKWPAATTLAKESLAKLKEIEDLLPKQKQNQQNQQQKQNQDKQDKQDKQQPQQKPENKPEPKKEPPKPEKQEPQKQDKDEMSEEKAREILQKARLREKEYQDEKQKRAFFDRAPGERDW